MSEKLAFLSQARTWHAFYTESRVAELRPRLYLEALVQEYPADEATDGCKTRSELREMVVSLHISPSQKFAGLARERRCTRGHRLFRGRTKQTRARPRQLGSPSRTKARV
jgi:hypothetical protein